MHGENLKLIFIYYCKSYVYRFTVHDVQLLPSISDLVFHSDSGDVLFGLWLSVDGSCCSYSGGIRCFHHHATWGENSPHPHYFITRKYDQYD